MGGECVAEISALYPQVFVNSADAMPIIVELRLNDVGTDRRQPDFDVKVIDARTGNALGDDGFSISTVQQKEKPTPVAAVQGIIQVNSLQDAHHHLIALGYAGAIVAALSKSENGGRCGALEGEPPSYVAPVVENNGMTAAQTSDNTAQAIGVLMGTMSAVDAMNQRNRTAPAASVGVSPMMPMMTMPSASSVPVGTGVPATSGTSATGSSGGDPYKRICQIHGEIYDIRYGSGCQWCKQPDFGSGKTTTHTCTVHGYKFDPKYGCPACQRMRNGSK